ncbi:RITA1 protein, partial [Atractosteus spatula]|nr:RITA1 protein [Atractosteus spatula]
MAAELAVRGVQAFRAPSRAGRGCRGQGEAGRMSFRREGVAPSRPRVPASTGSVKADDPAPQPKPGRTAARGKRSRYRLKSHLPSYCDESLFGPPAQTPTWEPPWAEKKDGSRSQPLLWTPSTCSTCCAQAPHVTSAHPPLSGTELEPYQGKTDFWRRPESEEEVGDTDWRPQKDVGLVRKTKSACAGLGATDKGKSTQLASLCLPHRRPKTTASIKAKPPWKY